MRPRAAGHYCMWGLNKGCLPLWKLFFLMFTFMKTSVFMFTFMKTSVFMFTFMKTSVFKVFKGGGWVISVDKRSYTLSVLFYFLRVLYWGTLILRLLYCVCRNLLQTNKLTKVLTGVMMFDRWSIIGPTWISDFVEKSSLLVPHSASRSTSAPLFVTSSPWLLITLFPFLSSTAPILFWCSAEGLEENPRILNISATRGPFTFKSERSFQCTLKPLWCFSVNSLYRISNVMTLLKPLSRQNPNGVTLCVPFRLWHC